MLIKVVCCSPEKIKQKIICKGGCAVKSIEIIEKPKEKPKENPKDQPEKPKEKPKDSEKPKEPEKPKEKPKEPEKPKESEKPKEPEKPKEKPKEPEKPKENPKEKPPQPQPQPQPQLAYPFPFGTCCTECYDGRGGGPCYSGHARPPPSDDGYYGRPIYDSYGGGGGGYRSSYGSPCDYFSEENSSGCSIM